LYSTQTSSRITKINSKEEIKTNLDKTSFEDYELQRPLIDENKMLKMLETIQPIKEKFVGLKFTTEEIRKSPFLNVSESDLKTRNLEKEKRENMTPEEHLAYLQKLQDSIPNYKGRYFKQDKSKRNAPNVLNKKENVFQISRYEMRRKQKKIWELANLIKKEKKEKKHLFENKPPIEFKDQAFISIYELEKTGVAIKIIPEETTLLEKEKKRRKRKTKKRNKKIIFR